MAYTSFIMKNFRDFFYRQIDNGYIFWYLYLYTCFILKNQVF